MGNNVQREKAIQLQLELDEAQKRFDEAVETLRLTCPHTYILEYESMEYRAYSCHYMCVTCGLWEDHIKMNGVLDKYNGTTHVVKHVKNTDEYCNIRDDIFRVNLSTVPIYDD